MKQAVILTINEGYLPPELNKLTDCMYPDECMVKQQCKIQHNPLFGR